MSRGKYTPEVSFSIEARKANPAQLEAGERLFGRLIANARESTAQVDGQSGHGRRQPPGLADPPHSLTGGL